MIEMPSNWSFAPGLLLLSIPLMHGLVAALPVRAGSEGVASLWRRAATAASVSLCLAIVAAATCWTLGDEVYPLVTFAPVPGFGSFSLSLRLDVLTVLMLALVNFVGVVILDYSRRYLDGDGGQVRYVRWFLTVLASVSLLVMADNLLLIWLAWLGTSLALHQLLTFYADRPQALIAAHKKFITSRVADLCLLVALTMIAQGFGSVELEEIFTRLERTQFAPASLGLAAVLLAAAAALKCAQLPFHGWLIQVMEAPTPVSALLHAGVINIGGFLMIRLAPLMVQAELAQTLLVLIGSITAVVASLVMMTRVSIKVALAWSTCAQMGFMLLECGLGMYSIALLHLLAHSLYKAHAFLISGSTVEVWRAQALTAPLRPIGLGTWITAAVATLASVGGLALILAGRPGLPPALWVLIAIFALSLTTVLVRVRTGGVWRAAILVGATLGVSASYLVWHLLFDRLIEVPEGPAELMPVRIAIVALAFGLLFLINAVLESNPTGRIAHALYPPLFAGLYLDEFFTRITFRFWPARLPAAPPPPRTLTLRPARKENDS
jgi:NAD(P)H-quinone oxidoreductase subunit 5